MHLLSKCNLNGNMELQITKELARVLPAPYLRDCTGRRRAGGLNNYKLASDNPMPCYPVSRNLQTVTNG